MPTSVLVTGATGLLGSELLRQAPAEVIVDATYHHQTPRSKITGLWLEMDLSDADMVTRALNERRYDLVINCVGASDVDRCETDQAYAMTRNISGAQNLITAAGKHEFRLIHFSTDYVFDGKQGPYSESDQPDPVNFYGQTKLMAEEVISSANIDSCIIRICSLYATDPEAPKNIYKTIADRLASGSIYSAADDLFSNPTEVSDLAGAVWRLTALKELPPLVHLAAPDYLSRYEFAVQVAARLGAERKLIVPMHLVDLALPAKRPLRGGLTSNLALRLLGKSLRSLTSIS